MARARAQFIKQRMLIYAGNAVKYTYWYWNELKI